MKIIGYRSKPILIFEKKNECLKKIINQLQVIMKSFSSFIITSTTEAYSEMFYGLKGGLLY